VFKQDLLSKERDLKLIQLQKQIDQLLNESQEQQTTHSRSNITETPAALQSK